MAKACKYFLQIYFLEPKLGTSGHKLRSPTASSTLQVQPNWTLCIMVQHIKYALLQTRFLHISLPPKSGDAKFHALTDICIMILCAKAFPTVFSLCGSDIPRTEPRFVSDQSRRLSARIRSRRRFCGVSFRYRRPSADGRIDLIQPEVIPVISLHKTTATIRIHCQHSPLDSKNTNN